MGLLKLDPRWILPFIRSETAFWELDDSLWHDLLLQFCVHVLVYPTSLKIEEARAGRENSG
jgi:hypothetical protein